MPNLELKVPPPLVALVLAGLMWAVARLLPSPALAVPMRGWTALALALAGLAIAGSGAVAFRRAKTTVNPMKPEATTSLVVSGIYRVTRNPMYLGVLVVLLGWLVFLGNAWAALGPVLFVAWINRFQIVPEERVLRARFGAQFDAYAASVRRWL